jgi:hypothetical protein
MNPNRFSLSLVLLVAALATGCSTLYEGKYDFREGWRPGEVVQIAPGSQITRPAYYTCLRKLAPEDRTRHEYAIVRYKAARRAARHAVQLPEVHGVQVGTKVYINVDRCDGQLLLRQPKSD